ncbi:MAG TPA: hypothetical protein VHT74_00065 [Acetobacteraceae bacterium]|jgi:hypothetical protein|nr:hypothetical protein [Acetobacteraceae bacterium]
MPPPDAPKVVMVPVKRYDINLTLHDILTPLTQMAQAGQAPSAGPDVQQHVQQLSDLAGQLRDVVNRLNKVDPSLLAPTPRKDPPGS